MNKQREELAEAQAQAQAEVDEKADGDSVDSLICAYESPMPMRDPLSETQGSALRLSPEG